MFSNVGGGDGKVILQIAEWWRFGDGGGEAGEGRGVFFCTASALVLIARCKS